MSRKNILIAAGALTGLIILAWIFMGNSSAPEEMVIVRPVRGDFEIAVVTTGELQAVRSVDIMGPTNLRQVQLGEIKIADLVDEGTVVDSGETVGQLDVTDIQNRIQDVEINIQKFESELEQVKLDCTLTMAEAREGLINLAFAKEERKLDMDEASFEPPSTQRQAAIEYDKSVRALEQAIAAYQTKKKQSEAKVRIAGADLEKEQRKLDQYRDLMENFTIKAEQSGMVIYYREWDGKKRVVGSMLSPWDPVVATLPDLSEMESITTVNEVDIQKIKTGLNVSITFDAIPGMKVPGTITQVAKVAQPLKDSDAKVFEVKIRLSTVDSLLRPAMTTGNKIHIETIPDVIYIQLDAIFSTDEKSFVFLRKGGEMIRQEVKLGKLNDNYAVVTSGLLPEDEVLLSFPNNGNELEMRSADSRNP